MDMLVLHVTVIAVVGGILCLENSQVLNAMLTRPLITGTVLGYLHHDPASGMIIGALFELMSMWQFPIGGRIPFDKAVMGISGVSVYLLGVSHLAPDLSHHRSWLIVVSLASGLLGGWLGRIGEFAVRRANERMAARLLEIPSGPGPDDVSRAFWSGLGLFALKNILSIFAVLGTGLVIAAFGIRVMPVIQKHETWLIFLAAFLWLIPGIGIARLYDLYTSRKMTSVYFFGFAAMMIAIRYGLAQQGLLTLTAVAALGGGWYFFLDGFRRARQ